MKFYSDFERRFEYAALHIAELEVIFALAARGWALYECAGRSLLSHLDMQAIIEMGRAKDELRIGVPHVVMPFSQDDSDWSRVYGLYCAVVHGERGPYWVEFDEGESENGTIWTQPVARFLIDSVIFDPPLLHLIIDKRMSNVLNPNDPRWQDCGEILLPMDELWKISGDRGKPQLQRAMR